MSEQRCKPPEHLCGVDGWHWLLGPNAQKEVPTFWWGGFQQWAHHDVPRNATHAAASGYSYLSPVLTPAEADALRAERDAAACDYTELREAHDHKAAELATLRAEVGRLRKELDDLRAAADEATTNPAGNYITGLFCGVEDRGITDRYEAAEFGWQQAFEYAASCLPARAALTPEAAP